MMKASLHGFEMARTRRILSPSRARGSCLCNGMHLWTHKMKRAREAAAAGQLDGYWLAAVKRKWEFQVDLDLDSRRLSAWEPHDFYHRG